MKVMRNSEILDGFPKKSLQLASIWICVIRYPGVASYLDDVTREDSG